MLCEPYVASQESGYVHWDVCENLSDFLTFMQDPCIESNILNQRCSTVETSRVFD